MESKQINLWIRKKTDESWKIDGFVHDSETLELIVGATVYLDRVPTQTNERGFFRFEGIAVGEHIIVVEKEGYESTNDPEKPSVVNFMI